MWVVWIGHNLRHTTISGEPFLNTIVPTDVSLYILLVSEWVSLLVVCYTEVDFAEYEVGVGISVLLLKS